MTNEDRSTGDVVSPFIDGRPRESESEKVAEVFNPSTGKRCLLVSVGCESDVNHAVNSARESFDEGRWADAPPSFRKKTLARWADLIAAHAKGLDALDAEEMGKPISEQFANAMVAADLMRYYAEAIDKITGDVYVSDKRSFVAQRRVPRGVVAAIVPWNFPTLVAVLKIAPALAAGNSVVLKPSELSSRSAIQLAQLGLEAGLPRGTLNVVPGLGGTVGRALGLHRNVDMVAFTGSTTVGKLMQQYAGQSNMKVVQAECGGKSPHIVFADGVDLDGVAETISKSLLVNQGQICSIGSRLLVQRSIEEALVGRIVRRLGEVTIGNALDPSTTFGPVASAQQCERIQRYIEEAQAEGAKVVTGGRRVLRETGGYFLEPTVFREVSPGARIAQEEIFGPVLSVIPFEDESDAARIANCTVFGLTAYVWTASLATAMTMARKIRSSVRINAVPPSGEGSGYAASSEPAGESGIGVEGGLDGMESYMRRQRIWVSYS